MNPRNEPTGAGTELDLTGRRRQAAPADQREEPVLEVRVQPTTRSPVEYLPMSAGSRLTTQARMSHPLTEVTLDDRVIA